MQTMFDWYVEVLSNYAKFNGRASRAEFWYFALCSLLLNLGRGIFQLLFPAYLLPVLYGLAMFVPNIAVNARRLHDTDRSGWWQLIALIPLLGAIILLVFLGQKGQPNSNRFGPTPKLAPG